MGFFRKFAIVFCVLIILEGLLFGMTLNLIGIWTTIFIAFGTGFLGLWLTKKQGLKALQEYQKSISTGQIPHREVVDGILIMMASTVLVTPGFLTDFIGFSLLVPPIRAKLRGVLAAKLKDHIHIGGMPKAQQPGPSPGGSDDVINIETEVIDEK